jgi:hypothetical protein
MQFRNIEMDDKRDFGLFQKLQKGKRERVTEKVTRSNILDIQFQTKRLEFLLQALYAVQLQQGEWNHLDKVKVKVKIKITLTLTHLPDEEKACLDDGSLDIALKEKAKWNVCTWSV